jgi:hypothetical protein
MAKHPKKEGRVHFTCVTDGSEGADEAVSLFLSWLSEIGEQQYWEFVACHDQPVKALSMFEYDRDDAGFSAAVTDWEDE